MTGSSDDPEFLDLDDVLELHRLSLAHYGGADGVRDIGLLESAIAQPSAAFADQFAHEGLYAMAAAYLYHIACNHPLIDGNKRTALLAGLVFLDLNASLSSTAASSSTSSRWASPTAASTKPAPPSNSHA